MFYRKLTASGDATFGSGSTQFLKDTPECVAQAVRTKLKLFTREWFLNLREGLNLDLILGKNTRTTRDREIKRRILETPGVNSIRSYSSTLTGRNYSVTVTIDTVFGTITITESF